MRRALALVPLFALAACTSGPTWQVVSVRTAEDQPAAETSVARVRIDDHRFTGTTGCADVTGTFEEEEQDTVSLNEVELSDPGECSGWARHTHDQLAPLLTDGASFSISRPADFELVLVGEHGQTLRLMQ